MTYKIKYLPLAVQDLNEIARYLSGFYPKTARRVLKELREKITSRKQEIQRLRGIVRSLYENLVQGVLTKDEYFDYKEKYESRIADLAVEMEQLEDGLRTMDAQAEQHRALEQDAAQIKTDRALTGALIERLIDRIEVSHDKQITVRYRFQSEFETYAEVLEQCRNM